MINFYVILLDYNNLCITLVGMRNVFFSVSYFFKQLIKVFNYVR